MCEYKKGKKKCQYFFMCRSLTLSDTLPFPGGKCVLFFGSRSQCKDYFFEDEWLPLQNDGRLTLFTAFSRDQVIGFFDTNQTCSSSIFHYTTAFPCRLGRQNLCTTSFERKRSVALGSDRQTRSLVFPGWVSFA
jgi:hypothetical protein